MRTTSPARRLAAFILVAGVTAAGHLSGQATRPTSTETDLAKDPNGIPLLHVAKGAPLAVGAARAGWTEVTIDGWIVSTALHDDKRDGFDISVSPSAGTALRDKPGTGAILATARFGALFDRVEVRGTWVHVRRTGWVPASALAPVQKPAPKPAPAPPPAAPVAAPAGRGAAAPSATTTATISAGSSLSLQPGGPPFASIEIPVTGDALEHRNGWTRVRIDTWVRDAALANAPVPGGITAADLRAAPDKYVGQTVEWTIEVLGIETADELRPEIPEGQPYVLARGPLPESGFVYVVITKDDVDAFRKLDPLAKIRIRATIRAGKSRFLPTPVLNFVRRLD